MALVVVRFSASAPARAVWERITDWEQHGRFVPLTTVAVHGPPGLGQRFVGRTALGPVGFDDPMEVTAWRPPAGDAEGDEAGTCTVVKQGRVVLGWAALTVTPRSGGRCDVEWLEDVEVPPRALTSVAAPLVAAGGRFAFGRMVRGLAADAEAAAA